MAYIALYRKYRSQTFDTLMGQEAVTTTLQNSLKSGRFAHAYLFHGARGCGKTSTARLLARALNCIATDGPTPVPCGICRLCTAIRDGSCMDVVEMDAASETGIDDVREKIVENVQYAPGEARYKVYIIDEVHDLSAKAFDALLKTLEEPPANVVFILATTEIHKVPITIRSRCQLHQFKRGSLQDLSAAIQRVVAAEGYSADPEAIQSIARAAEGSWRDALSLLEQVISYSESTITAEAAHQALGMVGSEMLGRVVDTIARGDWSATLGIAGELVDSGKDVRQLLAALQGYLRDLMMIASGALQAALNELGEERLAQLTPHAAQFTPTTLLTMIGILAAAEKETRFSNQHRWLLERTLCHLQPACLPQGPSTENVPVDANKRERETTLPARDPATISEGPKTAPRPDTPEPRIPAVRGVSRTEQSRDRFVAEVSLSAVQRSWPQILKLVRQKSPSGAVFVEKARPIDLQGKVITLVFAESYARDRIHDKGRVLVEAKINECLGTDGYRIRCVLVSDGVAEMRIDQHPSMNGSDTAVTNMASLSLLDQNVAAEPGGDNETALVGSATSNSESMIAPPAGESSLIGEESTTGATGEPAPTTTSFLAETLSIFGGEIVKSEPI